MNIDFCKTQFKSTLLSQIITCSVISSAAFTAPVLAEFQLENRTSLRQHIEVEQSGGEVIASFIDKNGVIYSGEGPKVVIRDIKRNKEPKWKGQTDALPGVVTAIAKHKKDTLFVASAGYNDFSGGVHIFDMESDYDLKYKTELVYGVEGSLRVPEDIFIEGNTLYLLDSNLGMFAFDISYPKKPELIASAAFAKGQAIEKRGDFLFTFNTGITGGYSYIYQFDANTLRPMGYGQVPFAKDATFQQNLENGAITAHIQTVDERYIAYNIDDIHQPVELFATQNKSQAIFSENGRIYTASEEGLRQYDAFTHHLIGLDPTPMKRVTSITKGAEGHIVAMSDKGYLYQGEVSDQETVVNHTVELAGCTACMSTVSDEGYVYAADNINGLRVMGKNKQDVGRLNFLRSAVVEDIKKKGDTVYLADWAGALSVVDVADPTEPSLLTNLWVNGFPSSLSIAGNNLYVGQTTNGGTLWTYDITEPSSPQLLSQYNLGMSAQVKDLHAVDSTLLLGTTSGLMMVDTLDPSNPQVVGHFEGCDAVMGVWMRAKDKVGVLGCNNLDGRAVVSVDLTDITNPTQISKVNLPSEYHNVWSLDGNNDTVYVGQTAAVTAFSLDYAGQLVVKESYPTTEIPFNLEASTTSVTVSSGRGGMFTLSGLAK
ncbi:hypothetical protein MHO82_20140 [Vibrio sp. Of7-15]|uniref:hypothetical protein n=1 Tax=Vibrio sp. Of7-15 TaxID=2724879 RepID=UPI001EF31429|nr:hypothetical protein [Vibrio sp. Of7-15]MCG7499180.1 hypothetical protein [Vibrio sp. Of7-15]